MDVATSADAARSHQLVPEPPFGSLMGLARHLTVAGLAGLFTGVVVGGIGGRIFMRIAGAAAPDRVQGFGTEAGFTVGEVTVGGTLALIIFIGIMTGVAGAILFVVFNPWISWSGHWRGPLFGVVLFGVASATSDVMNPDNIDFFILKNSVLLVVTIAILFLSFGVVMDFAYRFLDRRLPGSMDDWGGVGGIYVALSLAGVASLVLIVVSVVTDSACNCGPPVLVSWSVVLAALGTTVWWGSALFASLPAWSRLLGAALGYTGLIGALVFGLLRAFSDAAEIIA